MNRFQHTQYFHFLWFIIPLVLLFLWYMIWRKKSFTKFATAHLFTQLAPESATFRHYSKFILVIIAFVFVVIGIANPQMGMRSEKVKRRGIDVMIALDVSNSMLAQDIKPNRLEKAKLFISKFMEKLQNDRIGLIVFAGNAYQQVPLTTDYSTVKMYLPLINTTMVPTQGTAIGEAVNKAMESFNQKEDQYKALVIITDGEDHDSDAEALIKEAADKGIKTFTIGVGEETGAPIPINNDFKRDGNGNIVMTKFDRGMLSNLANIGQGQFYQLAAGNDIVDGLITTLEKIESKELEDFQYSDYESYFHWILLIALFFMVLEFFISERKSLWFEKFNLFNESKNTALKKGLSIIFLITFSSFHLFSQTTQSVIPDIRQGNKLFLSSKYAEAEISYRKALDKDPKNKEAIYNLGTAQYQQQKFEDAIASFKLASEKFSDDNLKRAASFHNLGNSFLMNKKPEEAIQAYKNALKINPTDMDTKYNLVLAQQEKQKQDQQKKQDQNKDKNKKDGKDNKGSGNQDQKDDGKGNKDNQKDGGKDEEGKKGDNESDKNGNNDGGKEPKEKQGQMSKEQAEKLLEALQNEEKKTQEKVLKLKGKPKPIKVEKDW